MSISENQDSRISDINKNNKNCEKKAVNYIQLSSSNFIYLCENKYCNLFCKNTFLGLIYCFFSMLSRHVEHKRCPFFFQNDLVDLSISFLQIKHLNIGDI